MTLSKFYRAAKPFALLTALAVTLACGIGPECDTTPPVNESDFRLAWVPAVITIEQGQTGQANLHATGFGFRTENTSFSSPELGNRVTKPGPSVTNDMPVQIRTGAPNMPLGTYMLRGLASDVNNPARLRTADLTVHVVAPSTNKVFQDQTFTPADWTAHEDFISGGATHTEIQMATGGVVAHYRHMQHIMPGDSQIRIAHVYKEGLAAGRYNPATDGAITKIDFSEHRIQYNRPFASAVIAAQMVILQNGNIYAGAYDVFGNLVWAQREEKGLVATDFTAFNGTHPNFSATGAPMWFGFQRSNGNQPGPGITYTHGIDDWKVTVYNQ